MAFIIAQLFPIVVTFLFQELRLRRPLENYCVVCAICLLIAIGGWLYRGFVYYSASSGTYTWPLPIVIITAFALNYRVAKNPWIRRFLVLPKAILAYLVSLSGISVF